MSIGAGGLMKKIRIFLVFALTLTFSFQSIIVLGADKKKIKIITTCGLIAQRYSYARRGNIPTTSVNELVGAIPSIREIADVSILEFCNVESVYMTPQMMFDLAMYTWKVLKDPEIAGVVIIYGTDTVEESAFMLDLLIDSDKPIVITGAQRPPWDPSPDGPANLLDAVRVAVHESSRNRGTLVLFNGNIYSGREASKVNANDADCISSPYGPMGKVVTSEVTYLRPREKRYIMDSTGLAPSVYLIKMAAGMDGLFLRIVASGKVDGVVVEGFGPGNLNEDNLKALRTTVMQKIPVVVVSRCGTGFVDRNLVSYSDLVGKSVISGGDLTGPKARILLMLALNRSTDPRDIQVYFDKFSENRAISR